MHFDDRLATVLRFRASSTAALRAQFRQLLDLLGTCPSDARGDLIDTAYVRLSELDREIPAAERAAMLDEPALRLRSPRLVASLAAAEPRVAEAAIAQAWLTEEQWLDLVPVMPPQARALLRRRPDAGPQLLDLLDRLGARERGLPPAEVVVEAAGTELADTAASPAGTLAQGQPHGSQEGIGALVRRIEEFRRARHAEPTGGGEAPRLPLGEEHLLRAPSPPRAFDFATDATGRIIWSDPGMAPMVVGLLLAGNDEASTVIAPPGLALHMSHRQPLRRIELTLSGAPAIAGQWQIDATPRFDPLTGAFTGYCGRMRRPADAHPDQDTAQTASSSEGDRIRQLLHELRTPVNAIQGFAEVIQQQLFGSTPHEYRAHAAAIAGDAARMLAGFDELERLAKLDTGALSLEDGECDLAEIVTATVSQLEAHTAPRGSGFTCRIESPPLTVPLARIEIERLVWRLLATLAGVAAPGEQLKLKLRKRGGRMRLTLELPAALAARSSADLFAASAGDIPQALSAGMFGVGFALRLATAEAHAAGGVLERKDSRIRLSLPASSERFINHGELGSGATG